MEAWGLPGIIFEHKFRSTTWAQSDVTTKQNKKEWFRKLKTKIWARTDTWPWQNLTKYLFKRQNSHQSLVIQVPCFKATMFLTLRTPWWIFTKCDSETLFQSSLAFVVPYIYADTSQQWPFVCLPMKRGSSEHGDWAGSSLTVGLEPPWWVTGKWVHGLAISVGLMKTSCLWHVHSCLRRHNGLVPLTKVGTYRNKIVRSLSQSWPRTSSLRVLYVLKGKSWTARGLEKVGVTLCGRGHSWNMWKNPSLIDTYQSH